MPGNCKTLSAVPGPQIKNEFKLEGAWKAHKKNNRTGRCVSWQRESGSSVRQQLKSKDLVVIEIEKSQSSCHYNELFQLGGKG